MAYQPILSYFKLKHIWDYKNNYCFATEYYIKTLKKNDSDFSMYYLAHTWKEEMESYLSQVYFRLSERNESITSLAHASVS